MTQNQTTQSAAVRTRISGAHSPRSRIPIVGEDHLREGRPDFVFILPWNLKEEIVAQLDYIRAWGGKFVRAVPALEVI